MIIKLDKIPEQGLHLTAEEPGDILGLEDDPAFSTAGPVRASLYAQVVDEMLIVRGTVSAEIRAECARCTQMFSTTVVDSGFLRDYSDIQEVEEVDMTESLREAIILELPRFPLCDEGCKGLCFQCGKDLNDGPCGCSNGDKRGAWEALDNLKL
ncbi:MAG: DUF177 domain-containing protein [Verrucomicrobia bacterium]|nr:DUF177 domain-containing protein [Verrucomicrobiota bacterium]